MFYITTESRNGTRTYVLTDEQNRSLGDCKLTVSHDKEYVALPKGNPTGRQFFVRTKVDEGIDQIGTFAFAAEDKTPRVLKVARAWKDLLTPDELKECEAAEKAIAEAEATLDRLHEAARNRKPKTATEKLDEANKKAAELLELLRANGIEIPDNLK